jgi:hypothetical protein
MERQLTVRGLSSEARRRLKDLSRARGDSVNTTVRRILEQAVGADSRRRHLEQYATWNADDAADFDRALAEHNHSRSDFPLWTF